MAVTPFARQYRRHWLVALGVALLTAACMTHQLAKPAAQGRGIRFVHEKHKEGLECSTCHVLDGSGKTIASHDVCSNCHEIDTQKKDPKQCEQCHTRADQTFDARKKLMTDEVKFTHDAHTKKEVACASCHAEPDKSLLPAGVKTADGRMKFCMDCHGKTSPALNECSVCHTRISKSVRPTQHNGVRIAHDAPQIWARTHGEMSRNDPAFCVMCHADKTFCEDCHQKNPPQNHTLAWKREGHGLRAQWDRTKCAACHEEDFCLKCHQKTEPANHRAGWESPRNRHCLSCHFPARDTNCTVCHESIDHKRAMRSPHNLGIFPVRCGQCHPAGLPNRAPHPENSTTHCLTCH